LPKAFTWALLEFKETPIEQSRSNQAMRAENNKKDMINPPFLGLTENLKPGIESARFPTYTRYLAIKSDNAIPNPKAFLPMVKHYFFYD
jgi:hypothetical protein